MYSRFIFIAFISFCVAASCTAANEESVTNDKGKVINQIQDQINEIESHLDSMVKIQKDILGKSSEGGAAAGFFEGDNLRKMVLVFFGDMGRVSTEFYLKDGKLFYVSKEVQYYDRPMHIPGAQITKKERNSFYISESVLVSWLDNDNKTTDPQKHSYKEELENLLKESEEYSKDLKDEKRKPSGG